MVRTEEIGMQRYNDEMMASRGTEDRLSVDIENLDLSDSRKGNKNYVVKMI